jgi:hypothetical protein
MDSDLTRTVQSGANARLTSPMGTLLAASRPRMSPLRSPTEELMGSRSQWPHAHGGGRPAEPSRFSEGAMQRALVRAVVPVLTGLILVLSAHPMGFATLPNRAQLLSDPPYQGWWEQWIVKDRVRFLYNPNDFVAGADVAYVEVEDLTRGKLKINFAQSDFPHQESGLSKKSVSQELNGFYVQIPSHVRTGDYPYHVKFACRPAAASCPSGTFYVSVRKHEDQLLDAKVMTRNPSIPVVDEGSEFAVELHARKPISRVRLIQDSERGSVGVASFELRRRLPDRSEPLPDNMIGDVSPGQPFHGLVRVTRASSAYWNYLVSDWRGTSPELSLMFEYDDEYGRHWTLRSSPTKFEYHLPSWAIPVYYLILLGLATAVGIAGRFVAVAAVDTLRTGTKVWVYALPLAGLLFVLGHVLRVKVEPVGLFPLEVTNLRGILATGLVAGFVPELIRGRIRALLGAPH